MDTKQLVQDQELIKAREELEKWKKLVKGAETERDRLVLEKLDTDEEKKKAHQDVKDLMNDGEQLTAGFNDTLKNLQAEITAKTKTNQDLQKKLQHFMQQMNSKKVETDKLQQRFKIKAQIPEKRMRFTHVKKQEEESDEREHADQEISAVFTIIQRPSFLLKGGEALITFEEEKVADQILKLSRCFVTCDGTRREVMPNTITLEPSAKFEVHIKVSKRTIKFSNASARLPEERMRDRLELGFSKPSRGGGEVERVEYDAKTGAGLVTFLNTGVAEKLTLRGNLFIDATKELNVTVEPLYNYQLKKFQTFLGVPMRSILLRGICDVSDEEDMQDHLEIHFQKPSNYGGEVESIKYVGNGKKLRAFFSEDRADKEA